MYDRVLYKISEGGNFAVNEVCGKRNTISPLNFDFERTNRLIGPITTLTKFLVEQTWTSFFSNNELTHSNMFIFWWSNLNTSDVSNTILLNIERTQTSFYKHQTNLNVFIYWGSNSNNLLLALIELTSNIELTKVFTRFTKLLIQLTRTSIFQTSNRFERVHLLVIELEHPTFGFERSNIELRT